MATTNFQQWNNAAINQETDAQYSADSLRTGGAPVAGELPSPTFNKFAYQSSTFYTAFAQMLLNKGFSTSDADINVLSAVLANIQTSADIKSNITFVPYSPTPTLNASNTNAFYLQLNGPMTLPTITGLTNGQIITLMYLQDGTGGRMVTYPTQIFNATQPDQAPAAFSAQLFQFDNFSGGFLRPISPIISDNGLFLRNNAVFGATLKVGGAATFLSPITAPAAAVSGNANLGSLQIAGGAPNGQVLTGNGTSFVPAAPAVSVMTRSANLAGSRSFNVTYPNTTGKPMFVSGGCTTNGGHTDQLQCLVGTGSPTELVFPMEATSTVSGAKVGFFFCVPAGDVYTLQVNGTAYTGISELYEQTLS